VFKSLSKEVRDCHARAEACAEKAQNAFNAEMREDFLRLRDSWLKLAQSYQFAERLIDFTNETEKRCSKWRGLHHSRDKLM
jgi:hypothetical protein